VWRARSWRRYCAPKRLIRGTSALGLHAMARYCCTRVALARHRPTPPVRAAGHLDEEALATRHSIRPRRQPRCGNSVAVARAAVGRPSLSAVDADGDPAARGAAGAALEDRIEAELALARHARLIGQLKALIAEHPLHERHSAQLMLALSRSGRHAEAVGRVRDTRAQLERELALESGPELRALEQAILTHDPSLAGK
jgi:hypothetical protein